MSTEQAQQLTVSPLQQHQLPPTAPKGIPNMVSAQQQSPRTIPQHPAMGVMSQSPAVGLAMARHARNEVHSSNEDSVNQNAMRQMAQIAAAQKTRKPPGKS